MSLRLRLKSETRAQHEMLEAKLDLQRPDFSLADLQLLLERFYGYYEPCEMQICHVPGVLQSQLDSRRKLPLLTDDLMHFGHTQETLKSLPKCRVALADSEARALGRWYVFEGSTLGGQLLSVRYEREFGLSNRGCSFFRGYGANTGLMWREFCKLLDDYSSPATDTEVLHAAATTFESMASWLCAGQIGE